MDRSSGRVYLAANGSFFALDYSSGATVSGYPVKSLYDNTLLHNYGGIALVSGVAYVALGGLCDNGNFIGGVVSVNVSGSVPTKGATFRPVPGGGVWGGGVWGAGGVVSSLGSLWTAVGNANNAPFEWSYYGEHGERIFCLVVLGLGSVVGVRD